jgi:uncharacterized membrane protein (UPF0127 family)
VTRSGSLRVRNLTRGVDLGQQVEVARGTLARGLGLMGRRGWPSSDGLLLERCNSVHTFFMRMPIDVALVAADGKVLRVASSVRPWRVGPLAWGARRALELPAGVLAASATAPGDRLSFDEPSAP